MSALPPKADIAKRDHHVRFVPKADVRRKRNPFPSTYRPVSIIFDNLSVMNRTAVVYALISAALFGVSTPAAKLLVGSIHPVTLAGLLYCGAGIGVAGLRRIVPSVVTGAPEIAISRAELPWLAA